MRTSRKRMKEMYELSTPEEREVQCRLIKRDIAQLCQYLDAVYYQGFDARRVWGLARESQDFDFLLDLYVRLDDGAHGLDRMRRYLRRVLPRTREGVLV